MNYFLDALNPELVISKKYSSYVMKAQGKIMSLSSVQKIVFSDDYRIDLPVWMLCHEKLREISFASVSESTTSALDKAVSGMTELDLDSEECFTNETFRNLITESHASGLPYFLIVAKDKDGDVKPYDAYSLLRSYVEFERKISPYTRSKIVEMNFIEIEPTYNISAERIKLSEKSEVNKYCRLGLASSLKISDDEISSRHRFDLAFCFLEGICGFPMDKSRAVFWFKKAVELNHADACRFLIDFYRSGETDYVDEEQAIYYQNKYRFLNSEL